MSIEAGEPVTYIGKRGTVVRSYVAGTHDDEPAVFDPPPHVEGHQDGPAFITVSREDSALLFVGAEGVAWIRGHHNANSDKARELLAIAKLTRSAA